MRETAVTVSILLVSSVAFCRVSTLWLEKTQAESNQRLKIGPNATLLDTVNDTYHQMRDPSAAVSAAHRSPGVRGQMWRTNVTHLSV